MQKTIHLFIIVLIVTSINSYPQTTSTFTDTRDGKTYKTVEIGGNIWMAENLKFWVPKDSPHYVGPSYFYEGISENYHKYGRLYPWDTACKACPDGWILPTKKDWYDLINSYGEIYSYDSTSTVITEYKSLSKKERKAYRKAKRQLAKETYIKLAEGGSSGFNVLYGGFKDPYAGAGSTTLNVSYFFNLGSQGYFWTLDDNIESGVFKNSKATGIYFVKFGKMIQFIDKRKSLCFSVRCVKDTEAIDPEEVTKE